MRRGCMLGVNRMSNSQYHRGTCYLCGDDEEELLEKHHIVPRRHGGSDRDENLVRLCPTCHRKIENLYDYRFYNTLGIENGIPTNMQLVRELIKIDFTVDLHMDALDVQKQMQEDILCHFNINRDLHFCDSCESVTFFTTGKGGDVSCCRCDTERAYLTDGYGVDEVKEVFGDE